LIQVGIGELKLSTDLSKRLGLRAGSCVAITAFDPVAKVGAMLHVVLPQNNNGDPRSTKFADSGLPVMLEELSRAGAERRRLIVKLAGGAQTLALPGGGTNLPLETEHGSHPGGTRQGEGAHCGGRLRRIAGTDHGARDVLGKVFIRAVGQQKREL